MCGRFYFSTTNVLLQEFYEKAKVRFEKESIGANLPWDQEILSTGVIFPSNNIVTLIGDKRSKKVASSWTKWGLVNPQKQQEPPLINARQENIFNTRLFSPLFKNFRCIIPTSGFYEWKSNEDRPKTKFLFYENESEPLYLAGLYRMDTGYGLEIGQTSVILTTSANESISDAHNRMPLIVKASEIRSWLFDDTYARSLLKSNMPELQRTIPK